jgi:cysteine desulfurase
LPAFLFAVMRVYLDNAATTPINKEVLKEMQNVMETIFGNPSSIHSHGREARTVVEKARKTIAGLINASPSEIFFTSGGTEADNTAIRSSIVNLNLTHAVTTLIEHHAVLHTLQSLEKNGLIKLSYVDTDAKGNVDLVHLQKLLTAPERSFVSLMHANNEIGTLTDIKRVGEICEIFNAVYHCDTVQTLGHYFFDVEELKTHFLVCAAHKLHGPKGVGFMYINHKIKAGPLIFGGSQERNMRGGTENIYGIIGMAKALEIAYQNLDEDRNYIRGLKDYLIEQLKEQIPGVVFNGEIEPEKSLYTILNASFPFPDMADMLLFNLDIEGISVSGGSACSSGTNIGSHVLMGIGADENMPAIRFSFSRENTKEEIDYVMSKLKQLVGG